jgi:hypothetical protein
VQNALDCELLVSRSIPSSKIVRNHNAKNLLFYAINTPYCIKKYIFCAIGCIKCSNLVIVTNNEERTIEKDGFKIDIVPVAKWGVPLAQ